MTVNQAIDRVMHETLIDGNPGYQCGGVGRVLVRKIKRLRRELCAQKLIAKGAEEKAERLINLSECIYCGVVGKNIDLDHWKTCPKHPVRAEIERLRRLIRELSAGRIQVSYGWDHETGKGYWAEYTGQAVGPFDTSDQAAEAAMEKLG